MEGIYVHIFRCHAAAPPPISPALSCPPSNESEICTLDSRFPSVVDTTLCKIATSSRYASSPECTLFRATSINSRYAAEYGINPNAYLPNVASPWFNTFSTSVGVNVTLRSCNNSAALHRTFLSKSSFKSSLTIDKMPFGSFTALLLCFSKTSKGLAAHNALGRVDIRKVLACSAIVNEPSVPIRLSPIPTTSRVLPIPHLE